MIDKKYLSQKQKFVPGIYGGLGPMSHIRFEEILINECNKRGINKDQDYPVWLLASGTSTPDRTKSIKGGRNALKHLIYFSKLLETEGADFLVITCNTAHFYKNKIEKNIGIPIISIIESAANYIARNHPLCEKVGIIATDGTIESKLYQNALSVYGIQSLTPNPSLQKNIMEAIYNPTYGIKATGSYVSHEAKDILKKAVSSLSDRGAEMIIAGCTEISIGLSGKMFSASKIIDPLEILAHQVIDQSYSGIEINKGYKEPKKQKVIYDYKYNFLQENAK